MSESTNNQFSPDNTTATHRYTGDTIKLQANDDDMFVVNESHVTKLAVLNRLIEENRRTNPSSATILVRGDSNLVSDFSNTFELLNAS
ncbi:hypothetical protein RSOLAG1IB_02951 [Rhizoctonia solani AG-1 IB]|uniref:Uncharacterized protein n=1 Tax=Thanatephorus cucumeris (strain AG1-IB / isolate 7/3/14) TaxID=1108050 RepID=A0A0B7FJQ1_THACB|nr:hypothetical protein RSOLAG1IB_02951 [Rhizoctonia solani AG-1 IB]